VVETAPEIRTEGDVTIAPVVEKVFVVEKRLVLEEELHIRRRVETDRRRAGLPGQAKRYRGADAPGDE
jgi:hypothetical protein